MAPSLHKTSANDIEAEEEINGCKPTFQPSVPANDLLQPCIEVDMELYNFVFVHEYIKG